MLITSYLSPQTSYLASALGRLAVGVEGVGDDFGRLAPAGLVAGPEVELADLLDLAGAFVYMEAVAGVAADDAVEVNALDVEPERVGVVHVGEGLLARWDVLCITRRVRVDLGEL